MSKSINWQRNYLLPTLEGESKTKEAVKLALAGGHSLLILGDAGMGKTYILNYLAASSEYICVLDREFDVSIFQENYPYYVIDDYHMMTKGRRQAITDILGQPSRSNLIITARYCRCGLFTNPSRQCICSRMELITQLRRLQDLLSRIAMVSELGDSNNVRIRKWLVHGSINQFDSNLIPSPLRLLTPEGKGYYNATLELGELPLPRERAEWVRIAYTLTKLQGKKRIGSWALVEAKEFLPYDFRKRYII